MAELQASVTICEREALPMLKSPADTFMERDTTAAAAAAIISERTLRNMAVHKYDPIAVTTELGGSSSSGGVGGGAHMMRSHSAAAAAAAVVAAAGHTPSHACDHDEAKSCVFVRSGEAKSVTRSHLGGRSSSTRDSSPVTTNGIDSHGEGTCEGGMAERPGHADEERATERSNGGGVCNRCGLSVQTAVLHAAKVYLELDPRRGFERVTAPRRGKILVKIAVRPDYIIITFASDFPPLVLSISSPSCFF